MKATISLRLLVTVVVAPVPVVQGQWIRNWFADLFNDRASSCPFSRTNIADDSDDCLLPMIPDTLKGSLTVTKSQDGTLLAGTWTGGHESTSGNPNAFRTFSGSSNENVWSVTKTRLGTELLGTPDGVQRKGAGETSYTLNRFGGPGAQGSFAVLEEDMDQIFVGTFDGLFVSQDDGQTWLKAPTDCLPYNLTEPEDPNDGSPIPKPPDTAKYCEESVNHLEILPDGSLVAFYFGYGGAHRLVNPTNPFVESSWEPYPTYQESEPCLSAFCLVQDAAVFDNFLYVTFQSLAMVRLDLNGGTAWELVDLDPAISNVDPMAVHALDGTLYVSTFQYGMYQSTDGTNWQKISTSGCGDIPLGGLGMTDTSFIESDGSTTKGLVFGTQYGPWFYRVD